MGKLEYYFLESGTTDPAAASPAAATTALQAEGKREAPDVVPVVELSSPAIIGIVRAGVFQCGVAEPGGQLAISFQHIEIIDGSIAHIIEIIGE